MSEPVYWLNPDPEKCDVCHSKVEDTFVDGKTVRGPWGIMCLGCHDEWGVGFGLGRGQMYAKAKDGFVKVKG
jgi:hypothetical protein